MSDRPTTVMSKEEHRQRHIELHKTLDELVDDYTCQNRRLQSKTTIMELMEWSLQQTFNPTGKVSGESADWESKPHGQ